MICSYKINIVIVASWDVLQVIPRLAIHDSVNIIMQIYKFYDDLVIARIHNSCREYHYHEYYELLVIAIIVNGCIV